eukprot:7135742-Prymnesium_polylepis.1
MRTDARRDRVRRRGKAAGYLWRARLAMRGGVALGRGVGVAQSTDSGGRERRSDRREGQGGRVCAEEEVA